MSAGWLRCDECGNKDALPTGPGGTRALCDCCATTAMIGPHECQTHAPKGSTRNDTPELCMAESPVGYLCTLDEGHGGPHAAAENSEPESIWPREEDKQ